MRVVDLDRDMSDVIPTGTSRDSQHLFDEMTARTLDLLDASPGRRVLDVASGFGQDARAIAGRGARVIGAEPSRRMLGWARLTDEKAPPTQRPGWVQAWSHRLPFADETFDAVVCKGALDHFDQPELAIGEMARVTRRRGRVVLAIANFESLACRAARGLDAWRQEARGETVRRGRRHYDVPADHFTRYDLGLMREQAERWLTLEEVQGVSLCWGFPGWTRALEGLPEGVAQRLLRGLEAIARRAPGLADVVVLSGRPKLVSRGRGSSGQRVADGNTLTT